MSYNQYLPPGRTSPSNSRGHKRKRHEVPFHEDIAWTATRCNRLLRTITSRLNYLRRLVGSDGNIGNDYIGTVKKSKAEKPGGTEHWSTADPVWLPNGMQKTKTRTYQSKVKTTKDGKGSQKPSLSFPSPFIRRIGGKENSMLNSSPSIPEKRTTPTMPIQRRSAKLPIKPSSNIQEVQRGLETALANLLSHTAATDTAFTSTGARSLLSSCIRLVPSYIRLDQDAGAGDIEKTTTEVFSYLENLGTRRGAGWDGLRGIVRSNAIRLICEAILGNILSIAASERLVEICSSQGALSEAQQILEAMLSSTQDYPRFVGLLNRFSKSHKCEGFHFRTLRALVKQDAMAVAKACESARMWTELLGNLSGSAGHEALLFVSECLNCFHRLDLNDQLRPAVSYMFRSSMSRLAVMAVAGSLLAGQQESAKKLFEAVQLLAAGVLRDIEDFSSQSLTRVRFVPLLCAQLLQGLLESSGSSDGALSSRTLSASLGIWSGRANCRHKWRQMYEEFVVEFVGDILALEKFSQTGLSTLLLDRVLKSTAADAPTTALLKRVAMELLTASGPSGALMDKADSEAYLERLSALSGSAAPPFTPHPRNRDVQFRWEEDLSEWVAVTPFLGAAGPPEPTISGLPATYHSPQVVVHYSPDALSLSPPAKRMKWAIRSPKPARKKANKSLLPLMDGGSRRHSNRVSAKQEPADSEDELSL